MEFFHETFESKIFWVFWIAPFFILLTILLLESTKEPTPKNKKMRILHFIWLGAIVVFFIL